MGVFEDLLGEFEDLLLFGDGLFVLAELALVVEHPELLEVLGEFILHGKYSKLIY